MELSVFRITLLVLLSLIMVSMVLFVCLCCLRTRRRVVLQRLRAESGAPSQLTPLLLSPQESGARESLPSLNYNDTLRRDSSAYHSATPRRESTRFQPTPFTQAADLVDPPQYDDLFGSSAQPYNAPTLLLDEG